MQVVQFRSLLKELRFHVTHDQKQIISSVSRYSTTKGRSRNKRQEGMKDERQRVQGGNEERMHRSVGEGAISNEGL